ncbi:hypothetical protein [Cellvibrio sp. NN19]|uniref:hypothetical protein n=1 Tax=Cellvibrio chitinivorans TaxID=3102792 RepID=UPI002B404AF7|nr:hypothetical protein [Cellvibrio sp. NN19]
MSPEDFINIVTENADPKASDFSSLADRLTYYYQKYWYDWDVVATYINHPDAKLELIAEIFYYLPKFAEQQPSWASWENHPDWSTAISSPKRSLQFNYWPSWKEVPAFYFQYLVNKKDIKFISKILSSRIEQEFFVQWVKPLAAFDNRSIDARLVENYWGAVEPIQEWLPHFSRSRHAGVRLAVAKKRCAPADILRVLCVDADPKVAKAALEHSNFPKDALAIIAEHESKKQEQRLDQLDTLCWNELEDFLTHPDFPAEGLDILSARDDDAILFACVMHPNASESLWRRALESPEKWQKSAVALNPNAPEAVLRELAQIESFDIAFALASNPSLPEDMQLALANHPDRTIRLHVADQTLSKRVWAAVASHPAPEYLHTPLEQFLALVIDPKAKKDQIVNIYRDVNYTRSDGGVMATSIGNALALHPKISEDMLGRFLHYMPWLIQHNQAVQLRLLEGKPLPNSSHYAEFYDSESWLTKSPGYLINSLLSGTDLALKRLTVRHTGCNRRLLFPLWFSSDKPLLKRLVQRTDMPGFFYEILWRKTDDSIRALLSANKAFISRAPSHGDKRVINEIPVAQKARTVGSDGKVVIKGNKKDRINLARSTDNEQVLCVLAADKLVDVITAVAERPGLPLSVIEVLISGTDKDIRLKAPKLLAACTSDSTLNLEKQLYDEGGEMARELAYYTCHEQLQLQMLATHPETLSKNNKITTNVAEAFFRYGPLNDLIELLGHLDEKPELSLKLAKFLFSLYEDKKGDLPGFNYFQTLYPNAERNEYQVRYSAFSKKNRNFQYIPYEIQAMIERYSENTEIQKFAGEFLGSGLLSEDVLAGVAGCCKEINNSVLQMLLKQSPEVRSRLAKNIHLSQEAIDALKVDEDESVRIELALAHPHLGEYFSSDISVEVRKQLAENTKNINVQKLLFLDAEKDVLSRLAMNNYCDYSVLEPLLRKNIDFYAKRYLVERPETSTAVLELLVNDRTAWICNQANRVLQERLSASSK